MTFLTILGVTEIYIFNLVLEGQAGKEILESSRLEFLEKFSANNFALSDAEDNTFGPWNSRGIADLPLLRTLLAIRQKSREPSFWDVMDYFVLLAYNFKNFMAPFYGWGSTASRLEPLRGGSLLFTTMQVWQLWEPLLACLNFPLESEDLSFWKKVISMNYGSSTSS